MNSSGWWRLGRPAAALVAGPTGLEALTEIVAGAPGHLLPGGHLLLEHGADQGAAVRVVGCQPYAVLAETARRAGARRREPFTGA